MLVHKQFFKFAVVGLSSNLLLYLAYLLFTGLGAGPKTTMSVLYLIGVGVTFVFNRTWTFGHAGHMPKAVIGYIALYATGFGVNFYTLYIMVDLLGYDHRAIQGVMIFILAAFFFLAQKFLVFRNP